MHVFYNAPLSGFGGWGPADRKWSRTAIVYTTCHKEDILTPHWALTRQSYPTYPHSVLSHINKLKRVNEIETEHLEIFSIKRKLLGFFLNAYILPLMGPLLDKAPKPAPILV